MILYYLHGLHSSPGSAKARQLAAYIKNHALPVYFDAPVLGYDPAKNMEKLRALIESHNEPPCLVGSSMGGFYATCLASAYGLKAALINPVVAPADKLTLWAGPMQNPNTGEYYEFTERDRANLARYDAESVIRPDLFLVLLQTGDEVLDYREAERKYSECTLKIQVGGDHSFVNFDQTIPEILAFFGMGSKA